MHTARPARDCQGARVTRHAHVLHGALDGYLRTAHAHSLHAVGDSGDSGATPAHSDRRVLTPMFTATMKRSCRISIPPSVTSSERRRRICSPSATRTATPRSRGFGFMRDMTLCARAGTLCVAPKQNAQGYLANGCALRLSGAVQKNSTPFLYAFWCRIPPPHNSQTNPSMVIARDTCQVSHKSGCRFSHV